MEACLRSRREWRKRKCQHSRGKQGSGDRQGENCTLKDTLPITPPWVADIVVAPAFKAAARPRELMVAA